MNKLLSPVIEQILTNHPDSDRYERMLRGLPKISVEIDKIGMTSRMSIGFPWYLQFPYSNESKSFINCEGKSNELPFMYLTTITDVSVYRDNRYQAICLYLGEEGECPIEILMRNDGRLPTEQEYDRYFCLPPKSHVKIGLPKINIISECNGQYNILQFNEYGLGSSELFFPPKNDLHYLIEPDEFIFDKPFIFRIRNTDQNDYFTIINGTFCGN
jgi:hypothetical protein